MVPSGASTGRHEAVELRDEDKSRYGGRGVLRAVSNVQRRIAPALIGSSPFEQSDIDRILIELDGTNDKSSLGANAVLATSLSVAQAASASKGVPLYRHLSAQDEGPVGRDHADGYRLPVPMFNVLNGGRHAHDSTDFQEFMVVPTGVSSFADALRAGAEIYHALGELLVGRGLSTNVGDEGGFAPSLPSNKDALEMILAAIELAGYTPGGDCYIAVDAAASEFFRDGAYRLDREGASYGAHELIDYYEDWVRNYPIASIEDGLAEDDWDGWQELTSRLGGELQLVGDDLYTTNSQRIKRGIQLGASNSVLIKPNQIGTITETLEAITTAKEAGWSLVMSHRSGETEDTAIADLSVGWDTRQIKAGAPCRSERLAKYNRLMRIEEELAKGARYAGRQAFAHVGTQQR